jgi:FKBP-type peptidyl-prolyl cis-trans isomerase FklB
MKNIIIATLAFIFLASGTFAQESKTKKSAKNRKKETCAATCAATEDKSLKNASDSLSYSFGLLIGNNMLVQGVKQISGELFLTGFNNGYANDTSVMTISAANQYVQDYFNKQISDESVMNLEKSNTFLAENKTKEGVVTTASGLQYKILTPGTGEFPKSTDEVKVHYTGMFIDGKIFDSSVERGEPIVFGVDQVIPGWTEALQLMQPGAKWMLYIPSSLAYGENGAGGVIGPNQALIFQVELLEIVKP